MIKKVDISTNVEIRNISTPVYRSRQNIELNTKDIRTCLMKGAYVYEILKDGSKLRLDLNNYNKDNNVGISTVVDFTKKEPVVITNNTAEDVPVVGKDPIVKNAAPVVTEEPAVAEEPTVDEVAPVVTEEPVVTENNVNNKNKKKR